MLEYSTGIHREDFSPTGVDSLDRTASASTHLPTVIPPRTLVIRISKDNSPSIKLFEGLGFRIVKMVEVFGEVEMRWHPSLST